jgi:hypothetical protein
MLARAIVLACALGLAGGGAASAQMQAQPGAQADEPSAAVRQACAADVRTLCPDAKPGGGQIKACLRQNAAKVSQPCKQALRAARAEKSQGAAAH